jgi:hypothetical protein
LRSSPEMKMCEIMARQEKATGHHNGAVETDEKSGQADIWDPRMEQSSRGRISL